MINFANNTNNIVADNRVSFCGLEYMLTDREAEQLKGILDGMLSTRGTGVSKPVAVSTPVVPVAVTTADKPKSTKCGYSSKDLKVEYVITKQTSTEGKTLYCISRGKSGWTKAEKKVINDAIKACDGIITIDVAIEGKKGTFKAWGFAKKKDAETAVQTLPTVFKKDDINKVVDMLNEGA